MPGRARGRASARRPANHQRADDSTGASRPSERGRSRQPTSRCWLRVRPRLEDLATQAEAPRTASRGLTRPATSSGRGGEDLRTMRRCAAHRGAVAPRSPTARSRSPALTAMSDASTRSQHGGEMSRSRPSPRDPSARRWSLSRGHETPLPPSARRSTPFSRPSPPWRRPRRHREAVVRKRTDCHAGRMQHPDPGATDAAKLEEGMSTCPHACADVSAPRPRRERLAFQ